MYTPIRTPQNQIGSQLWGPDAVDARNARNVLDVRNAGNAVGARNAREEGVDSSCDGTTNKILKEMEAPLLAQRKCYSSHN